MYPGSLQVDQCVEIKTKIHCILSKVFNSALNSTYIITESDTIPKNKTASRLCKLEILKTGEKKWRISEHQNVKDIESRTFSFYTYLIIYQRISQVAFYF